MSHCNSLGVHAHPGRLTAPAVGAPGLPRLLLALCLAASLVGCASSNLDERPGWAKSFESWAANGSAPGKPGADTPETVFARFPRTQYLFAVGEGRASAGQPAESRRAAVKDAQRELSNMLWVAVENEFNSSTVGQRSGDDTQIDERISDSIRTVSGSVLSDASVVLEWHGFEGGQDVAYAAVAIDRRTSAENLGAIVRQELTAARLLVDEVDDALARLDLAGVPMQVADLRVACETIRAGLLALGVLEDGRTSQEIQDDFAQLYAEEARLRIDVLESMTPLDVTEEAFVRGRGDGVLRLRLALPIQGSMQPLPGCLVRYERPDGRDTLQRVRTDEQGLLAFALPVTAKTAAGDYLLDVTYDLCRDHTKAFSTAGCVTCDMQRELAWQVPYRVVPDTEAYQQSLASATAAHDAGKLKQAQSLYTAAQELVFDQPAQLAQCQSKLATIGVAIQVQDAAGFLELQKYGEAVERFEAAHQAASTLPGADLQAASIADQGIQAALAYSEHQRSNGSTASRERCLERLIAVESRWDSALIGQEVGALKLQLPCLECGTSGRCATCKGSDQPGTLLADCVTCDGKGKVPGDCPDCADGFNACPTCAQSAGWKTCPKCKGQWSTPHAKCDGQGCKKCEGGQKWCERCVRCKTHKTWNDTCMQPGKVPLPCAQCGGDGKLRHKECEPGPLMWSGIEWKGFVWETCPGCEGVKVQRKPCPAGCDDGVCTTCAGAAHRV